ncbi:hypothetical protein OAL55_00730 [Verrucomicrobiales bacterium]|nr:hypothetical protein [Verrucomicrobiales bacterium]
MFSKFQFRFLINALVAIGVMSGFSHQMFAQFSEYHHSACEHSQSGHDHQDGDEDQDSSNQHDDCACLMCGVSMTTPLSASVSFRAPMFSLSEISESLINKNPVLVVQGIYHPPQG